MTTSRAVLAATVAALLRLAPARADDTAAAVAVVDAQLAAYNAHDLEGLLALFSPDCELYEFPDTLVAKGTDALRTRYAARLAEPNLHVEIAHRVAVGDKVIDEEHLTRTFPEGPGTIVVAVISEVRGGKVTRAWLIAGEKRLAPAR